MRDLTIKMRASDSEYLFLLNLSKKEGLDISKIIRKAISSVWPTFEFVSTNQSERDLKINLKPKEPYA